jgi:hypothetical protein
MRPQSSNNLVICEREGELLALRNQVLNGGLPEWPMGADCKSAGLAFSGSNPLPTTKISAAHISIGAIHKIGAKYSW